MERFKLGLIWNTPQLIRGIIKRGLSSRKIKIWFFSAVNALLLIVIIIHLHHSQGSVIIQKTADNSQIYSGYCVGKISVFFVYINQYNYYNNTNQKCQWNKTLIVSRIYKDQSLHPTLHMGWQKIVGGKNTAITVHIVEAFIWMDGWIQQIIIIKVGKINLNLWDCVSWTWTAFCRPSCGCSLIFQFQNNG